MQEIPGLLPACRRWTGSAHGRQWPAVVLGLVSTHWCVRLVSRLAQAARGQGRAPGVSGSGVCPLVGGPGLQGPRMQVPVSPSSACAGVRGWLSGGRHGLKDSSDSLSAGEGCRCTSLPAWLLGLRPPMLCVLLGARCRRYWARGRVPLWRWPAAASLGRDQLPVWLLPVSCPQCHGLPSQGHSGQPVGPIWLF